MRVLAGFVTLAVVALAPPHARADEPTKDDLLKLERRLEAAHRQAWPALACVVVSRGDQYPKPAAPPEHAGQLGGFDRAAFLKANPGQARLARRLDLSDPAAIPDHGFSGGVVIDPAGLVLVNYHTIDGATRIYVHLPGGNGSYADVRAADSRSDLAVLKLLAPPEGLKAVTFGTPRLPESPDDPRATVAPGKLVLVMAYTFTPGFEMTSPRGGLGTVTAVRRKKQDADKPGNGNGRSAYDYYSYAPLIEFDARQNPGCSGAAVLDLDGAVVGLTTTVAAVAGGESGPGYAMPADDNFRRIVGVLRRGEEVEYGFLGVTREQEVRGVVVGDVARGSPADAAGLRARDVITRVNGHPVRDFEDLLYYAGSALAGTTVELTYRRAGQPQERDTEVTLAKFRSDAPFIASVRPDPVFGLRVDYGSIYSQLAQGGLRTSATTPVPEGVFVRELVPDSPAAAKFKALGENARWVVRAVNGTPVRTPAEFYKAAKGQASVKLTVVDPTDPRPKEVTLP